MARRARDPHDTRLTDAELEIMDALWAAGEADVGELVERLADGRAYTTVATLLKILEQKGHVTAGREGRRLVYRPSTDRPRWERAAVGDLLQRVFQGNSSALVRSLLETGAVDGDELREIWRTLGEADDPSQERS